MPKASAQYEMDAGAQEATLVQYAMGAFVNGAPNQRVLVSMVRLACDHRELAWLEDTLTIEDDTLRGFMFLAVLSSVLERCALECARAKRRELSK